MATTPTPKPSSGLPPEVYAIYCGGIEQANSQKVVNSLTVAMASKVAHVHLLFQSAGGYIADGVFLYNLFRSVTIELTLYNAGQISSAGVTAYLGAKHRKTTTNATFMLHRSTNSPQFATAAKLSHAAKSLVLDDGRTEEIVRSHVNFPPELWDSLAYHDIYVSGKEAVEFGLADSIGEFSPPLGTQVFNLLA
ncbi:MAG TPA: ATP-dependent Clp protease proteolytic subunit [Candidatus Aquilonibacter sp.]|jgi:ATP-dependent Clp protease protease subunit|nr:ATP-dependent Clp protease proteolytic subunit [Candidatus Aquilonibacter sp.]